MPKNMSFKRIETRPLKRFPPAVDRKSIVNTARIVERLRAAGENMLAKELEEMKYMNRVRGRFMNRLVHDLLSGRINRKEFRQKMGFVDRRIQDKTERVTSVVKKRAFLLRPRTKRLASLAMTDPFFKYIYSHNAFSELVKRKFTSWRKSGVQTIVFFDVDLVKQTNDAIGSHLEGGTALLTAYAEAVKEVCDKYNGIGARYGTDEFTLHFYMPKEEVTAIVDELKGLAKEKILSGTVENPFTGDPLSIVKLRDAMLRKEIPGTVTSAIIQVDFDFQHKKFQEPQQIYANVMNNASKSVMQLKKGDRRGTSIVVEDNKIIEKNLQKK
ncbi:MAG TPA: diguanylate cyclase [Candidatus Diapherotrites archaeon]|uniref:Diguanylate cyclase n=1 Tax=Candidatus Iainarchaeum sp. TaxID=3101447 RepID=A0A7J4IT77_9ARCH|nr:diguanylate cyclase [Candidatus Diapherotrites archaeon]